MKKFLPVLMVLGFAGALWSTGLLAADNVSGTLNFDVTANIANTCLFNHAGFGNEAADGAYWPENGSAAPYLPEHRKHMGFGICRAGQDCTDPHPWVEFTVACTEGVKLEVTNEDPEEDFMDGSNGGTLQYFVCTNPANNTCLGAGAESVLYDDLVMTGFGGEGDWKTLKFYGDVDPTSLNDALEGDYHDEKTLSWVAH